MFHFLPIAIRYDGSRPAAEHGYQVHIGPMYSDVRGTVTLKSTRPATSTRRCGSTTCRPRTTAASGSRWSAPPGTSSTSPRSRRSTPASSRPAPRWRPTRRSSTGSPRTPRPRCTRRAPPGWASTTTSVLDPTTMRVHGVDGLRVVDASSMPYVTNGNIYAPVMMLAEKAADLIAGQHPAAPVGRTVLPLPRQRPAVPARAPGRTDAFDSGDNR